MDNLIVLNDVGYEAHEFQIQALLNSGAIYQCDDHNAYHLNPDHNFTVTEVEMLMNLGQ